MTAAVEQALGKGWNVNDSDAVTSNDPERIYKGMEISSQRLSGRKSG